MEEAYFNEIRGQFCAKNAAIKAGKMMSSEAIIYENKVFAFFSRKQKMVFKLGKTFDPDAQDLEIVVFNPFKKRAPLHGWFELDFLNKEHWERFAEQALEVIKKEIHNS
ncbi:MAG: hypothetical protein AAFR36_24580 [Bacteroidota bacterium]